MKMDLLEVKITAPEGVTLSVVDGIITVKGPKGELSRSCISNEIEAVVSNNELTLSFKKVTKREKKQLFSLAAHVRNLCRGVTEGHEYNLKICSGHFPMNVSIKGDAFEIKNFIGEAVPRRLKIKPGAEVKIEGDAITVTGIEKEIVAQTAASIENLTRRPGFDSRIFQDGIYIVMKDGKELK